MSEKRHSPQTGLELDELFIPLQVEIIDGIVKVLQILGHRVEVLLRHLCDGAQTLIHLIEAFVYGPESGFHSAETLINELAIAIAEMKQNRILWFSSLEIMCCSL